MKKVAGIILILIQVLVAAGEGLCIILAFVNSETIKKWGDLLSPDKNFERLTPGLIAALRIPSLAAGILFLALGIFVFSRACKAREIIQGLLASLVKLGNRFVQDGRTFFRDAWQARPGRVDSIILCVTVIIAAIARLLFINRTIEYDEAYTFAAFARYGFRYIASTYYVPNNQIFHTILVRVSTLLFGDQVWAIRLPTFIASLFLILFIYFLGRALYNRAAGITAAVIVAFLPDAVIRSVSARGYVIVTLMAVLAMLMATYMLKKRNILAWTLLVVFCALGFYTIPMMLYPCGLIFMWLLLAGVNEKTGREYGSMLNWIMYVFIAGVLVAVLTILLYAPILLNNDLAVIYQNNRVLQPLKLPAHAPGDAPGMGERHFPGDPGGHFGRSIPFSIFRQENVQVRHPHDPDLYRLRSDHGAGPATISHPAHMAVDGSPAGNLVRGWDCRAAAVAHPKVIEKIHPCAGQRDPADRICCKWHVPILCIVNQWTRGF
jgi:hypothetical protein